MMADPRSTNTSAPAPLVEPSLIRGTSARRLQILELFTSLVARNGYDKTSIKDLAETLDVSKGTIIHHFSSKDQLFLEMSYTYMERRMTEIDAVVEAAEHPSERLRLALTALFLVHRDDRDATLAVSREFVRFIGEPMMAGVRGLRAEYRKAFEAIIADGIQSGEFRKLDTAIVALGLFGMCNWAWTWYHPDGELGAEAVLAVFLQTAMGGILTDSASASSKVPRLPASVREQRENRIRDRGTLLAGLKLS